MKYQIVFLLVLFSLFGCLGGSDDNGSSDDLTDNGNDTQTNKATFTSGTLTYSHTYGYDGWFSSYNISVFNFSCVVNNDIQLNEITVFVLNHTRYTDLRSVYTDYDDYDFTSGSYFSWFWSSDMGIYHKDDVINYGFEVKNNGSSSQKVYLNQQHVLFIDLEFVKESVEYRFLFKYNVTQTNLGVFSIKQMTVYRID